MSTKNDDNKKKEDDEKLKKDEEEKKNKQEEEEKKRKQQEEEEKKKKEEEERIKKEEEEKRLKEEEKKKKGEKESTKSVIPRIKKLTTEMDEKIVKEIERECENIKLGEDASKIGERLYKILEKKFPTGWCVIVGAHFYALCVHEAKYCMEFEMDEFRVAIYKIYVPPGSK